MSTYNIALVPVQNPEIFIERAQKFFKIARTYLLGEHSKPHVTLCHFDTRPEDIAIIWEKVNQINPGLLVLTFINLRYKIYDEAKYGSNGLCWVSLIPEEKEALKNLHIKVAEIIKTPLNLSFDRYDPHLTLCNSLEIPTFSSEEKIEEKFILALGKSDNVGQLTEILYNAK